MHFRLSPTPPPIRLGKTIFGWQRCNYVVILASKDNTNIQHILREKRGVTYICTSSLHKYNTVLVGPQHEVEYVGYMCPQ
jgi:hypothetical protein